ncbi:LysR family transcriptional regulator [Kiloniella sp.]|uniref:LysR family transcriptional regulator n=1 Tax=Kiloniella sp. TaxID=1938587 RepID=UPI003B0110FA
MNWNDLKLFLAVAENKSLIGAARDLGMSHTTVFRHLNAFELGIGARLFERIKGGYELTELGEEMLVLAQGIASGFDDIDRTIIGRDNTPKGTVKLTATSSLSYAFLPGYIADFNKEYPDIEIELLVSNQVLNMTARHADIALRVSRAPPEHLIGREICHIKWGVYVGDGYAQEHGVPLSVTDLGEHRLICGAGQLRDHTAFAGLQKNYPDNIIQRSDDFIAMASLAEAGQGLALLPDDLARPGLQRCFTYEPAGLNPLWILTHPDLRKVERIKIVMGYLAKAFASEQRLACGKIGLSQKT